MKRKLLTIIAVLLVVIMAGCAAIAQEGNKVEKDPKSANAGAQTAQNLPTAEKTTKTVDEIKKIAFDHASVKAADVKDLEVELDSDNGTLHFDVSFDAGSYDYDYEIDAYTGKILKNQKEKETDKTPSTPAPTNPTPASTKPATTTKTKKTVAQVKKIALEHAGVKESAARDLEVELDKEGTKVYYEVTFESGGYDYEYDIDAYTGKILHREKERDD